MFKSEPFFFLFSKINIRILKKKKYTLTRLCILASISVLIFNLGRDMSVNFSKTSQAELECSRQTLMRFGGPISANSLNIRSINTFPSPKITFVYPWLSTNFSSMICFDLLQWCTLSFFSCSKLEATRTRRDESNYDTHFIICKIMEAYMLGRPLLNPIQFQ